LFSRAAYLGLATGMMILFSIRKRVFLVPLLIAAIFWQVALPDKVIQRIEQTTTESGELDASSQDRLVMWQISLDYFAESPLIGIGFGVFPRLGYALGDTHNIYCRILAEQGLVGIILFLVLLLIFFLQGLKLYRIGDDELSRGLGIGFAICIIVLLINNFFGNRWTYLEVSSNLWVFAGLVGRLIKISEDSQGTATPEKPKKLQPLHKRVKRRYAE
jgi:O-antigen ligase